MSSCRATKFLWKIYITTGVNFASKFTQGDDRAPSGPAEELTTLRRPPSWINGMEGWKENENGAERGAKNNRRAVGE